MLAAHCEDLAMADWQKLGSEAEVKTEKEDEVKDAAPRELPNSLLSSILIEMLLWDNNDNAEDNGIDIRGKIFYLTTYEQFILKEGKRKSTKTRCMFLSQPPLQKISWRQWVLNTSVLTVIRSKPITGSYDFDEDYYNDDDVAKPLSKKSVKFTVLYYYLK
jgi:hypothetical protein